MDTANRLQEVLEGSYLIQGERFFIQCYIGISLRQPGESLPITQLIHLADLAVIERNDEVAPNLFMFHPELKKTSYISQSLVSITAPFLLKTLSDGNITVIGSHLL